MKTSLHFLLFSFILFSCNQDESKNSPDTPTSQTHPPYTEKTACLLSQIAYCPDQQKALNEYLPGWKVVWNAVELGGNHVFVASDGTTYALAIRGSLIEFSWQAFQNWIYQDLNVASLQNWEYVNDSSKAKIAEGTYDGWLNLTRITDKTSGKTLLAFLENEIHENTPVLITGHSLGGNLATVYASYLWQKFKKAGHQVNNINVITFAAPAAGNVFFANDFDKKFPNSLRFENKNDIVPKFPCASRISVLDDLYNDTPAASEITVGYKSVTTKLSNVFMLIRTALRVLEFYNGNSVYTQTNGSGTQLSIDLSGKNNSNDISSWLSEAGYQHGISRYAEKLDVPVVACSQ